MKEVGTITIQLEGVTWDETERIRCIINYLFEGGLFLMRNGAATIHFDSDGMPGEISTPRVWKRGKAPPVAKSIDNVKIQIKESTLTQTTSGTSR